MLGTLPQYQIFETLFRTAQIVTCRQMDRQTSKLIGAFFKHFIAKQQQHK
jgi:hypothetical protein